MTGILFQPDNQFRIDRLDVQLFQYSFITFPSRHFHTGLTGKRTHMLSWYDRTGSELA